MKVTLLSYAISRDHIGSLHKAGCKDIDRDVNHHAAQTYDYDSKDEALADYIDGEMAEMGYSPDDLKIYPLREGMKFNVGDRILLYTGGSQHRGRVIEATRDEVKVRLWDGQEILLRGEWQISHLSKRRHKKYPEAMLWARAVSQLCRMLFADCFARPARRAGAPRRRCSEISDGSCFDLDRLEPRDQQPTHPWTRRDPRETPRLPVLPSAGAYASLLSGLGLRQMASLAFA